MYQHLSKCEHFVHIIYLHRLPDIDDSTTMINDKQNLVNTAISNFCVLDTCCSWSQLLFLETLYKHLAPKINDGLKANSTFGQWSLWFSGCFVGLQQIHMSITVLLRSDNCFFHVLL